MLKPNLKNSILFIFAKYLVFYIFMMFKNQDYTLISIFKLKTFVGWLYYLYLFLSLPIAYSMLFIVMLHYAITAKNLWKCISVLTVIFGLEYVVYTAMASSSNYFTGLYNAVLSAGVLWLFFYKSVRSKAKIYRTNS